MANHYKRQSGDRPDGRRIRSLNGFYNFIPYIMPQRNDALNNYAISFEITNADRWFRKQRVNGYKGYRHAASADCGICTHSCNVPRS